MSPVTAHHSFQRTQPKSWSTWFESQVSCEGGAFFSSLSSPELIASNFGQASLLVFLLVFKIFGKGFQSLAVRRQEAQGKSHAGQTAAVGEEGLEEGQSDRQRTRSSDTQRQRKHCFQEPVSSVSRSQLVTLLHRPGSVGAEAPTLPWCFSPSGSRPNFPPTTHPTPTDFWVFLVSSSAQPALSLSP